MATIVGIDIGGTTVKLALVRTGEKHEIVTHAKIDTGAKDSGPQIVARMADAGGPMNTRPASTQASAKSAFSDRKP